MDEVLNHCLSFGSVVLIAMTMSVSPTASLSYSKNDSHGTFTTMTSSMITPSTTCTTVTCRNVEDKKFCNPVEVIALKYDSDGVAATCHLLFLQL